MRNSIFALTAFTALSLINIAHAENSTRSRWRCDFPASVWTELSETNDGMSACRENTPTLVRAPWKSQTVDAWSGGYEVTEYLTIYYRVDSYDPCTGAWLGFSNAVKNASRVYTFPIVNPNLDSSVTESYVANAPLLDEEAQGQLPELLQQCQSFNP
jgi:hypothetical protein